MYNEISSWTEPINNLIKLYEKLLELAVQQQAFIATEDPFNWPMDRILLLQDECQAVMDQIDNTQPEGIGSVVYAQQLSGEEKNTYLTKVVQIQDLVREIQTINVLCQGKLQPARQKVSQQMNQNRESKKACQAYSQENTYSSAWFIDKKR